MAVDNKYYSMAKNAYDNNYYYTKHLEKISNLDCNSYNNLFKSVNAKVKIRPDYNQYYPQTKSKPKIDNNVKYSLHNLVKDEIKELSSIIADHLSSNLLSQVKDLQRIIKQKKSTIESLEEAAIEDLRFLKDAEDLMFDALENLRKIEANNKV